jgi:hypothetical protein
MDPDPGGPKTYGSYGSGSATLLQSKQTEVYPFPLYGTGRHDWKVVFRLGKNKMFSSLLNR